MHKNMHYKKIIIDIFAVTFREEGVDWNKLKFEGSAKTVKVTFREEGVDWNRDIQCVSVYELCHLPRGRCGLKF